MPASGGGRERTIAECTVRFVVFLGTAGDRFTPRLIREWPATLPLHSRIELQRPGRVREVDGGEGRVRSRTFEYIVTGD